LPNEARKIAIQEGNGLYGKYKTILTNLQEKFYIAKQT